MRQFHFLKKGAKVLDLGAAPGGWSQVAAAKGAMVVAADVLEMEPIPGVTFFKADLTGADVPAMLKEALGGPADIVLTDMAAPTTGHRATDHIRTIALAEIALEVAQDVLKPGGTFVGKVFQGGSSNELLARLKKAFREVKHVKPPASRQESVELYVVAAAPAEQSAPAANLGPRFIREVLILREMEDMSYREIAEVTGTPIGTVMSRLAAVGNEDGMAAIELTKVTGRRIQRRAERTISNCAMPGSADPIRTPRSRPAPCGAIPWP